MWFAAGRSGEHTSELQSPCNLVCRLLLEKKKKAQGTIQIVCSQDACTPVGLQASVPAPCVKPEAMFVLSPCAFSGLFFFFFFNDPATTEISPLSLHDALPI